MPRGCNRSRRDRGSAILQALGAITVLSAGLYFTITLLIDQKNTVVKVASVLNVKYALHSLLDYTIYGIRQRYCFSNTFSQDTTCNLTHPASSERVMMSNDQASFLQAMIASGIVTGIADPSAVQLNSFERTVAFDKITSSHPLFPILQHVRSPEIQGIYVKVERVRDPKIPISGSEVYLKITAQLTGPGGAHPLQVQNTVLSVTSFLSVYARELGSFALVLPKDLWMDRHFDDASALDTGDVLLHRFDSRSQLKGGPGLVFLSPVYVNQNVHLPSVPAADGGHQGFAKGYAAVTFADRLYLGNGWIYEGKEPYAPARPGGIGERLWTDNLLFGGFLQGIENDGALDQGLQVLAGITPSAAASDYAAMQACIARTQKRSDRPAISSSALYANVISSSATSAKLTFGLTEQNSFTPQKNSIPAIDLAQWGTGKASLIPAAGTTTPVNIDAVFNLKIDIGGRKISAQMPISTTLSLKPQVGSDSYKLALQQDVADMAAKASATTATVGGVTTPKTPAQVAADKAALVDAQAALSDYTKKSTVDLPAMDISVLPHVNSASNLAEPHLVDINIAFKNPASFIDKNGDLAAPSVFFSAYDPTYFDGSPVDSSSINLNLGGYLNFSLNSAKNGFVTPDGLAKTPSGLPPSPNTPQDDTDYAYIDQQCTIMRGAASTQAFGGAGWDSDFSAQARHSWNFAGDGTIYPSPPGPPDPLIDTLVFDGTNAVRSAMNASFQVRSIVGTCDIKASADFVTGFLTCRRLQIEARTTPLRIIGTIIAAELNIDPSAYVAGITWGSIYHPQSTLELRAAGVLRSQSGASCDAPANPSWNPVPSIQEAADRFSCNAISLRAKANPFQWTTVDPDCGLLSPTATNTSCKHHILKFFVLEHARDGQL